MDLGLFRREHLQSGDARLIGSATVDQFQRTHGAIGAWTEAEHKDDGTHGAVTADSVETTGDGDFGGEVRARVGGEADSVQIGRVFAGYVPSKDIFGALGPVESGVRMRVPGQHADWSIACDASMFSVNPTLLIRDWTVTTLSQPQMVLGLEKIAPGQYALVPPASGNPKLYLGRDTQPWDEVNAFLLKPVYGVQFRPASVPQADPNTLDDYEEGDWTPVLSGTGGASGVTYTKQQGSYTKIGRLVAVNFEVDIGVTGTITGNAIITGLPFPANAVRNGTPQTLVFVLSVGWIQVYCVTSPGTSQMLLRGIKAAGGNNVASLTQVDFGGGGAVLAGGAIYTTDV